MKAKTFSRRVYRPVWKRWSVESPESRRETPGRFYEDGGMRQTVAGFTKVKNWEKPWPVLRIWREKPWPFSEGEKPIETPCRFYEGEEREKSHASFTNVKRETLAGFPKAKSWNPRPVFRRWRAKRNPRPVLRRWRTERNLRPDFRRCRLRETPCRFFEGELRGTPSRIFEGEEVRETPGRFYEDEELRETPSRFYEGKVLNRDISSISGLFTICLIFISLL